MALRQKQEVPGIQFLGHKDDSDSTGKILGTGNWFLSFSPGERKPGGLFGSGGKRIYKLKASKAEGLEVRNFK